MTENTKSENLSTGAGNTASNLSSLLLPQRPDSGQKIEALKTKYYYTKFPEFDAVPFPSRRPNKVSKLRFLYFAPYQFKKPDKIGEICLHYCYLEKTLEEIASKDLELILEDYLYKNPARFENLKEDLKKRALKNKYPSSLPALIESEITHIESLCSLPRINAMGVWTPFFKWAFDSYVNDRTVILLNARTYHLDSSIVTAMSQGEPLTKILIDFPFLKNSSLLKSYKCHWLEGLYYILHGASMSKYLEHLYGLKRMADNGQEIDFTGRIKLKWDCSNETIYYLIRKIRDFGYLNQDPEIIATFMHHNFQFENGHPPPISVIQTEICRYYRTPPKTQKKNLSENPTIRQINKPKSMGKNDLKRPTSEGFQE